MEKTIEPKKELVNGNTGEIISSGPSTQEIVEKVKAFLNTEGKNKLFFGKDDKAKRYPEYEDWQYIGSFYGCTAKTFEAQFVEVDGHKGFKAKSQILKDGEEIGRAEAYCLDDESMWRNKPLFQLASMAQTRSAAKAYANLFRPIARLAGVEGTPYEDLTEEMKAPRPLDVIFKTPKPINEAKTLEDEFGPIPDEIDAAEEILDEETLETPIPEHPKANPKKLAPVEPRGTISDKQCKLLYAKCKAANIPDNAFKGVMKTRYNVTDTRSLPWQAVNDLVEWIDAFGTLG
jgi:hypothetical protein